MPYTTTDGKTFWIDSPLPTAPNTGVTTHTYLVWDNSNPTEMEERRHPNWKYSNGAYVSDDYLYYNENYVLIGIGTVPATSIGSTIYNVVQKDPTQWIGYSTNTIPQTIEKTYFQREVVDNKPTGHAYNQVAIQTGITYTSNTVATVEYGAHTLVGDELDARENNYRVALNDLRRVLLDIETNEVTEAYAKGDTLTNSFAAYYSGLKSLATVGIALSDYSGDEIELAFYLQRTYENPYYRGEYTTNEDIIRLGIGTHPVFNTLGITTSPDIIV